MIAFLTGRVAGKTPTHALIEVHGVGYEMAMSSSSLFALPPDGDDVTVHTYLYVREDELSLFGFESLAEKKAFELLITVSGVGPKVALAALSTLSPDDLSAAVAAEDVAMISSVPGIGAKTAQRIILDLKDKLGPGLTARPCHEAAQRQRRRPRRPTRFSAWDSRRLRPRQRSRATRGRRAIRRRSSGTRCSGSGAGDEHRLGSPGCR